MAAAVVRRTESGFVVQVEVPYRAQYQRSCHEVPSGG